MNENNKEERVFTYSDKSQKEWYYSELHGGKWFQEIISESHKNKWALMFTTAFL